MMHNELTEILKTLIKKASVTPSDADCQVFIGQYLTQLGFHVTSHPNHPVDNMFARIGDKTPLLVFAGHTDVVAPGDLHQWHTQPFNPTIMGDTLFGRGAADMKGSLAAMLIAAKTFLQQHPSFDGSLGFLITSAEEGEHFDLGTPFVMEQLKEQPIDYCIVGEPSSKDNVGDMIRIGRRGSLSARVKVNGKQGHVAYPHLAENPIHKASQFIAELCQESWDEGNEFFPPTSLQVSNINAGTGSGNVIPGELNMHFNLRFCTEQTAEGLQQKINSMYAKYDLHPPIEWRINGEPFLTAKGKLLDACIKAIEESVNIAPELSTSGGTSDARFIAPYGVEVIELGPVNASIHQANEHVSLSDLDKLAIIYQKIMQNLFL